MPGAAGSASGASNPRQTPNPGTVSQAIAPRLRTNQPPPVGTWPSGVVSISASCIAHPVPFALARSRASVRVVVVPPLVRRGLRVPVGRVFPRLLAPERGDVEVAPGGAQVLVAA